VKRIFAGRRAALIAATAMVPLAITTASAQAATASPAQASATASTTALPHCTGQVVYTKTLTRGTNNARLRGFYFTIPNPNPKVCVGQANLRENLDTGRSLAERVRVHAGGAARRVIWQTVNTNGVGAGGNTVTFTTGVNRLFNHRQVTVCVALISQSTLLVVDNVVICKTLG